MKYRNRLTVLAGLAAIVPICLGGTANASPITNGEKICNTDQAPACIKSAGFGDTVSITTAGSLTNFDAINSVTWEGHTNDVWEYKQAGTNNCLEFDSGTNNNDGVTGGVRMDTCTPGRASQLWWYSGAHNLVNDSATSLYGQQACMGSVESEDSNGLHWYVQVFDCTLQNTNNVWYQHS